MCPGVERWLRPRWFTAWTIILPVQLTLPCEGKTGGRLWGVDTSLHQEQQPENRAGNKRVRAVRKPVEHERLLICFRTIKNTNSIKYSAGRGRKHKWLMNSLHPKKGYNSTVLKEAHSGGNECISRQLTKSYNGDKLKWDEFKMSCLTAFVTM